MPTKKVDRRVQRTRGLLQDALIAMMMEKGYEATTVQDIIDRANVGRATFYSHFADKETLLLSRLEDLRAFLRQEQTRAQRSLGGAREQGLGFSLAMLEHAKGHAELYQKIVGRKSGTVVMQRIQQMLSDLVRDDLAALGLTTASAQRDMIAQYVTGAFMGVLVSWLDRGAKLSPQEVDDIFRRLVMGGLGLELERQLGSARGRKTG